MEMVCARIIFPANVKTHPKCHASWIHWLPLLNNFYAVEHSDAGVNLPLRVTVTDAAFSQIAHVRSIYTPERQSLRQRHAGYLQPTL